MIKYFVLFFFSWIFLVMILKDSTTLEFFCNSFIRRYAENARCICVSVCRTGVLLPCEGKICCFLSLNVDSHVKLISSAVWQYLYWSVQVKLVQHTYSCLFGTFLCNNAKERGEKHTQERTCSVWSLLRAANKAFRNLLYSSQSESVGILHFPPRGESPFRGSQVQCSQKCVL